MGKIGNLMNGIYLGECAAEKGLNEALKEFDYNPGKVMKNAMKIGYCILNDFDFGYMEDNLKEKDNKIVIARSLILGQYKNISDVIDYSYMNANWIDGSLETQISCAVIGLLGHNAMYGSDLNDFLRKTDYKNYFFACKDELIDHDELGIAGSSMYIYNNLGNMDEVLCVAKNLKDKKYIMPIVAGLINLQDKVNFEIKQIDELEKKLNNRI